MVIRPSRFNIYLLLTAALLAVVGCQSVASKTKNQIATLRVHLESPNNPSDMTEKVSVLRASPMTVKIEKTAFLNETDIGAAMSQLNRVLSGDFPEGMFVTLFAVRLDPQRRSMVYSSAGHQANILFRSDEVTRLNSTGTVLGIFEESPYPTASEIQLHSGDMIVLATDGIMEQLSPSNEAGQTELYGWDRTMQCVRQHRHRPAEEILERLCQDVRRFAKGAPQKDDVTAVIIKVL